MNRILCLVTGASKGFGQAFAIQFQNIFPEQTDFVLISRNEQLLQQTVLKLRQVNNSSNIFSFPFDLSDLELLSTNLDTIFQQLKPSNYSSVYVLSNAGSLGPLESIKDLNISRDGLLNIQKTINLNITSCLALFSKILKEFTTQKLFLVNVSSLAAIKPFHSWALYCMGKVAREMLISVLNEETSKEGNRIKSLNYAPGPMDTEMQRIVREESKYEPHKIMFSEMKEKGNLVNPMDSAKKLAKLLKEENFQSGSRIDFFDK